MERETPVRDDLIELGAASTETLGGAGIPVDELQGQFAPGLSDD